MENAKKPISYKDIAAVAGVTRTTVSLALRNNPRISEKTRLKIQLLADKMGYVPDPKLASWLRYLRTRKAQDIREKLAYIVNYPVDSNWLETGYGGYSFRFKGASEMAKRNGYSFEVYNMQEKGVTESTLNRILQARGIKGVFIGDNNTPRQRFKLDWDRFAAVTIGYSLEEPEINRVAEDSFHSTSLAIRKLTGMGYRRVGFVMSSNAIERKNRLSLAAFLTAIHQDKNLEPVKPYLEKLDEKRFRTWLTRSRPDCIISNNGEIIEILKSFGYDCPGDIGFVHLNKFYAKRSCAGILNDPIALGAHAVRILIGSLVRNELGVPDPSRVLLIEGKWEEGETIRDVTG